MHPLRNLHSRWVLPRSSIRGPTLTASGAAACGSGEVVRRRWTRRNLQVSISQSRYVPPTQPMRYSRALIPPAQMKHAPKLLMPSSGSQVGPSGLRPFASGSARTFRLLTRNRAHHNRDRPVLAVCLCSLRDRYEPAPSVFSPTCAESAISSAMNASSPNRFLGHGTCLGRSPVARCWNLDAENGSRARAP
jgi:hypothetical protein